MIYLDHAATSPMSRLTLEAMWPYLTESFGNASSHHDLGDAAAAALVAARRQVAAALRCKTDEIVFTSGGTEANNYAIKGVAIAAPRGKIIVTTPIEHEAVLEPLSFLERVHGFAVRFVNVGRDGSVDFEHLRSLLTPDVTLCSVQYANSEIGTTQDMPAIAELCRAQNVTLHTDAVQAAGSLSLDVQALGVDLLSLSAHKFGGPKGVGALFRRRGVALEPLIHGGGQEDGARSGTSNVAGAVGLGVALAQAEGARSEFAREASELRDRLIAGVLEHFPNAALTGSITHRLPNHASFVLGDVSGESLVVELAVKGVACSSGSACAEGEDEPSHVLTAVGFDSATAQTAIRFTLGAETTSEDIEFTLAAIAALAAP